MTISIDISMDIGIRSKVSVLKSLLLLDTLKSLGGAAFEIAPRPHNRMIRVMRTMVVVCPRESRLSPTAMVVSLVRSSMSSAYTYFVYAAADTGVSMTQQAADTYWA